MTELYVNCHTHGKTHVSEWNLSGFFHADCGCEFNFNAGHVENLTERHERDKDRHEVDDHQGARYQDGSRELEGIMLQDGSFI